MWVPALMVVRGPMRTEFSRIVVVAAVDGGGGGGVVKDPVSIADAGDGGEEVGEVCGPPIMDFSPMMQPLPILMGPSKERNLVRGCITVPAPMEMGWMPWKLADSEMVVEGCAVIGGL
ncbi:hypothetical protein EMPG_17604 [Blastomyces silverae]|uniref:Uncharacterized protein n=1 Tax=Blastomyces silverae TaxID=2060906 RepID=A0A0H1B657_9EURO|nr:hypothetical protein EMPG_17604 [Blastomyces silverae]